MMTKNLKYLIIYLLIASSLVSFAHDNQIEKKRDLTLFNMVYKKIKALKSINYHYSVEFIYPSENYHSKSDGIIYIDFNQENDFVGFRYQCLYKTGFSIFNNTEIFDGNTQKKTISLQNQLKKSNFEGRSAIYNSIITLRNLLPSIIADNLIKKSIADTIINDKPYYMLEFETHNKFPNYLGTGFSTTTQPITFYQKIIIDRTTLLPVAFLQTKKGSEDLNRTDFTQVEINPKSPKENSWYYSSYLGEYKPETKQYINIIQKGKIAPDLILTNYLTQTDSNLSAYKGQLILLEFWIKNCSYCISAVPKLNALTEKYKPINLTIFAINTEDSAQSINLFIKNNPIKYTVYSGDSAEIINKYGITAFPQIVLINKDGRVIYAGDLDMHKLSNLIDQNMRL